jgi:N6-L-threonylcarbamoyladenine synthase
MRILAIETSCDETAIALLEITGPVDKPEVKILGNNLYSQINIHEQYGGVYPMLAKREHIKNLPILLEKTLHEASEQVRNSEVVGAPEERVKTDAISELVATIDFIAVTQGPGLEPALWTGIEFAENLGRRWAKPVVPVNHMEGHIFSVLPGLAAPLQLPVLALLISGGHTELVYMKEFGRFEILGQTKDDAVGESYDKVARMLGLSYPGGPKISRLAEIHRGKTALPGEGMASQIIPFPRPMLHSGDLNFSFSGLKTAVLYKVREDKREDEGYKEEVARSFDDAVMEVLTTKTRRALEHYDAKTLIVAGGVAASPRVQELFGELAREFPGLALYTPGPGLATDNAVMIGVAGFVSVSQNPALLESEGKIEAEGNLQY